MGKSTSDEVKPSASASKSPPHDSIAELQSEARQTRLRLSATVETLDQRVQAFIQQQRAALSGYPQGSRVTQASPGPASARSMTIANKNGPLASVIAAWMTVRRLKALWRSQTSSLSTSHKAWMTGAMIAVAVALQARRFSRE